MLTATKSQTQLVSDLSKKKSIAFNNNKTTRCSCDDLSIKNRKCL